jgi:hypothetical protein
MIASRNEAVGRGTKITWVGNDKDECEWVSIVDYPVKTVMIEGGEAVLVGRSHVDGEEFELPDANGYPVKSPGICHVTLNPFQIRPRITEGNPVRVTIIGSKVGF